MNYQLISEKSLDKIFNEIECLRGEIKEQKEKNRKKLTDTWLDNQEVMELLKISPRKLQNLRDTRAFPFSKVGAKIYYKSSDIENYLKGGYNGRN